MCRWLPCKATTDDVFSVPKRLTTGRKRYNEGMMATAIVSQVYDIYEFSKSMTLNGAQEAAPLASVGDQCNDKDG